MSSTKPVASGGHGHTIDVYENYVEIKYNIFKKVTIPIRRIDQVEIGRIAQTLTIHTDGKKHKVAMGTPGKAREIADAIMSRM